MLPPLAHLLQLDATASGVLAGLTVYAVPQVFAAASPMGLAAVQMGTVVKLVRVLMLGPVVTLLSVLKAGWDRTQPTPWRARAKAALLPGFIVLFLALAAARSLGFISESAVQPAREISNMLTILSMAGLGLEVDLRHVTAAGARVSLAVTLSLLFLGAFSMALIRILGLG
ncbi:MAG: putative sulfate exporter family transporter [Pseudomonadota bacterium]|nr:putative sulfate exporter family transporter [Pseudomonadota bacterium]